MTLSCVVYEGKIGLELGLKYRSTVSIKTIGDIPGTRVKGG